MLGSVHATVVDSASRNDRDICALPNVKIIVYTFLQSALAQNDRNMNALIDRSRFDNDVNSVLVLFCDNTILAVVFRAAFFPLARIL